MTCLNRYTGWLKTAGAAEEKGKQFDSTTGRGPFRTPIGVGRVIKGTQGHNSPPYFTPRA